MQPPIELPTELAGVSPGVVEAFVARLNRARRRRDERFLSYPEWLPIAQPRRDWSPPHMRLIAAELDKVRTGEVKNLILAAPPRHAKSTLSTILFPPYLLDQDPTWQICIGCFNATLAEKFGRWALEIARQRIPTLNPSRQTAADWETREGGYVRSVGRGNMPTGEGFNLLIVSDPFKDQNDADSPASREKTWTWFEGLQQRLEPGGRIIVEHTRWHEDDLIGRILEGENAHEWTALELPAEAEADDPLGRAPGDALWPGRWPIEELERRWAGMSERAKQAQYNCRPTSPKGYFFSVDRVREIDPEEVPRELPPAASFAPYAPPCGSCDRDARFCEHAAGEPRILRCGRAYDLAGTAEVRADYTVGTLLAGPDRAGLYYVLDVARVQLEPRERDALILKLAEQDGTMPRVRFPRDRKGDFGRAIVKGFVDMLEGHAVTCKEPKGSKALRAEPLQSAISHGKIVLVRVDWKHFWHKGKHITGRYAREIWKHEMRSFTGDGETRKAASAARNDDIIDSLVDVHAECSATPRGAVY